MTDTAGYLRREPSSKWVRAYRDGHKVVDSTSVELVWTHPRYPMWLFPRADVEPDSGIEVVPSPFDDPDLSDHVGVGWGSVDHWFEEDVEVFVHPRDPHTRVDALRSSRHVVARVDGTVVADSHSPVILYETGLQPRYYLPPTDVRLDLLVPSDTVTSCPYKGTARYWSVAIDGEEVRRDLVWSYPAPLPESAPVAGLMCFYDEKIDLDVSAGS